MLAKILNSKMLRRQMPKRNQDFQDSFIDFYNSLLGFLLHAIISGSESVPGKHSKEVLIQGLTN